MGMSTRLKNWQKNPPGTPDNKCWGEGLKVPKQPGGGGKKKENGKGIPQQRPQEMLTARKSGGRGSLHKKRGVGGKKSETHSLAVQ